MAIAKKTCQFCGSSKTYVDPRGYDRWYKNEDGYICQKCKLNLFFNSRRIGFKDKRVFLKQDPRIGKCSICALEIGDTYIGYYGEVKIMDRTILHHEDYHEDDPLKDTKEICMPCHIKGHNAERFKELRANHDF